MNYEIAGTVKLLQEPQTFSGGFTKREIVLNVQDGQYTQDVCIEFVQDKVTLLDAITVGQTITVFFNIKGREYNGRYFNNLQGWRIETEKSEQPKVENVKQESNPAAPVGLDDFKDVPF